MKIYLILLLKLFYFKEINKNKSKKINNRKLNDYGEPNLVDKFNEEKDKINHLEKFEYIADKFKLLTQKYKFCLKEHNEETIEDLKDKCLGINNKKVEYDIEYEKMRLMSKNDLKIRDIFIENCYKVAGLNTTFSDACDNMERDTLDLLWNTYNIPIILEINKKNYIDDMNNLSIPIFQHCLDKIKKISENFEALIELINTHEDMLNSKIKKTIEEVSQKPHYKNSTKKVIKNNDESAEIKSISDEEINKKKEIKKEFYKIIAKDIIDKKKEVDSTSNAEKSNKNLKLKRIIIFLVFSFLLK